MDMLIKYSIFACALAILLVISAFADGRRTFEKRVKVQLDTCFECDDRLIFLPEIETVEVENEDEAFVGIIAIEVDIDNLGEVTLARQIEKETRLGSLVAKKLLHARFFPKAELGFWKSATEVLYIRILPIVGNTAYPMINKRALYFPEPEISDDGAKSCTVRFVRLLVEFDGASGKVLSATTLTGDQGLIPAAESAALQIEFDPLPDAHHEESGNTGIIEYRFPRNGICSPIVSKCLINGRPLRLVKPKYPESARFINIRGSVLVSITIDEQGWVIQTKALSGHPLLVKTALRAAQQSRFHPITIGANPVRVQGTILYNFR